MIWWIETRNLLYVVVDWWFQQYIFLIYGGVGVLFWTVFPWAEGLLETSSLPPSFPPLTPLCVICYCCCCMVGPGRAKEANVGSHCSFCFFGIFDKLILVHCPSGSRHQLVGYVIIRVYFHVLLAISSRKILYTKCNSCYVNLLKWKQKNHLRVPSWYNQTSVLKKAYKCSN